jgi:hypothetical protein
MFDWKDVDEKLSVAYALGYCLRVVTRPNGQGFNCYAQSIQGEQFIGFTREKDAGQLQIEGWLKQEIKNYL